MAPRSVKEADKTVEAREILKQILEKRGFIIDEEIELVDVTNNMGEPIYPPYQLDMVATKQFVIELDTETNKPGKAKGHGTRTRRIKDKWRDRNILEQKNLKTVRLNPDNILKYDEDLTIKEIDSQLE